MQKKIMSCLFFMFILSSFFACELISDNNSDSPNLDNSLCNLMEMKKIFPAEDGSNSNSLGEFAEDFTYACEDGSTNNLSKFRGKKVILIKFWAKYCGYCMNSLDAFNKLHEKYSDQGLLVLGMNTFDSDDDIAKIMEAKEYSFRNVFKANPYMLTGYNAIPLNAMIDKDGKYRFVELGEMPTNEEIEKLLKELK